MFNKYIGFPLFSAPAGQGGSADPGLTSNRWAIAIAAVVMQVCLGGLYGWSVFVKPLSAAEGWSLTQVSLSFTLSLIFLGIGSVLGGIWQDRSGPRVVATAGGVLYGLGYVLAAKATSSHSLVGVYAGYGVVAGLGMGMAYICPVATLVKWFPDRKGLMTGIAVSGYGAGALLMCPLAARQIAAKGPAVTFLTLGLAYLVITVAMAQFYRNPRPGWRPPGWAPPPALKTGQTDCTVGEALRTPQFWLLWTMLFLNVSAGITIISQASPMAQQVTGMTAAAAAGVVGVVSLFNAAGRVVWAALSDRFGRANVLFLLYLTQALVLFAMPHLNTGVGFTTAAALIGFCYGGGFGLMPSFTADFFGSKSIGGIYGWILLAWGAGGIPAPMLAAWLRQTSGVYTMAIHGVAMVMVVALMLPPAARRLQKAMV
jgi:OFA family oxalate/formate antiporter-like MFS transporter